MCVSSSMANMLISFWDILGRKNSLRWILKLYQFDIPSLGLNNGFHMVSYGFIPMFIQFSKPKPGRGSCCSTPSAAKGGPSTPNVGIGLFTLNMPQVLKWQVLWGISNRQGREAGWWLSTCSGARLAACEKGETKNRNRKLHGHLLVVCALFTMSIRELWLFVGYVRICVKVCQGEALPDARWWCQLRFLGCLCLHISGSEQPWVGRHNFSNIRKDHMHGQSWTINQ